MLTQRLRPTWRSRAGRAATPRCGSPACRWAASGRCSIRASTRRARSPACSRSRRTWARAAWPTRSGPRAGSRAGRGPRVERLNADNFEAEIWRWLQAISAGREQGPVVHLGYGHTDRFAEVDALVGAVLPKARVYTMAGGHEWTTWRQLFARFLDASELGTRCR